MKAILRYLASVSILIPILLGIIWQHTELITMDSEEIRLKNELRSLKNRERQLGIEVIKLKSPGRIERLAQGLGFIHPPPEKVIILPGPKILARKDSKYQKQGWWMAKLARAEESHQLPNVGGKP